MDPDSVADADRVPHGSSDAPDVVDLSANVNPETPSGTREVYGAALAEARSYPDDGYPAFRAAAADAVDCAPERVVPTAGGLDAIRLAVAVTVAPGDSVLLPAPAFGEYAREVDLAGGDPCFVPQADLLGADPASHAMAVVCTPNNPTGDCPDPEAIRSFADRCADADTVLVVDEAFLGFTDRPSVAGRRGVVVVRSLTKLFGLPGLRAGFAVATGDPLDRLRTARRTWSLGAPAAAVGAHVMRDDAFVAETRRRVDRERAALREGLEERGFDVHPSAAPFLLCDVGRDPSDLLAHCRERGVVLRDATTFRGLDSHVRIAVRDRAATDALFDALDAL